MQFARQLTDTKDNPHSDRCNPRKLLHAIPDWCAPTVLIAFAVLLLWSSSSTFSQQPQIKNPPSGYRGVTWGTPKSNVDGLVFRKYDENEDVNIYTRKGEDLNFGAAKLTRVEYWFSENRLTAIKMVAQGKTNYDKVKQEWVRQHGEGKCDLRGTGPKKLLGSIPVPFEMCVWQWPDGNAMLQYDDVTGEACLLFGT